MRRLFTAFAIALAGCSGSSQVEQQKTIRLIESKIRLPKAAYKIEKYARYYAKENDKVTGVYVITVDPSNKFYDLPIGGSRWIDDYRNLPSISDGGCQIVNVIYDLAKHDVEKVFCNGEA
jgi:hypothetical protein